MSSELSEKTQRDAQVLVNILHSMGVDSFSPRVVKQLMELQHRFALDVLSDARDISQHADKEAIDEADLRLAVNNHGTHMHAVPPSRSELQELAKERNALPLPPVPTNAFGVHLPRCPPGASLPNQGGRLSTDTAGAPLHTVSRTQSQSQAAAASSSATAASAVAVGGAPNVAAASADAKLAEPSERTAGQVKAVPLDGRGGAAQKQKRKASQLESTDPAFRTDDAQ